MLLGVKSLANNCLALTHGPTEAVNGRVSGKEGFMCNRAALSQVAFCKVRREPGKGLLCLAYDCCSWGQRETVSGCYVRWLFCGLGRDELLPLLIWEDELGEG